MNTINIPIVVTYRMIDGVITKISEERADVRIDDLVKLILREFGIQALVKRVTE